jgi:Fur family ferric uptake transcriptional regulator
MRTKGEIYYEHAYDHRHHDHLVCESCGKTVEFYNAEIETLQQAIAKKFNFELTDHALKLVGICGKCKRYAPNAIKKS